MTSSHSSRYGQYEEKHISVARHLSLLDSIDIGKYDVTVYYDDGGMSQNVAIFLPYLVYPNIPITHVPTRSPCTCTHGTTTITIIYTSTTTITSTSTSTSTSTCDHARTHAGEVNGPAWKARMAHVVAEREKNPDFDETEENLHVLSGGWNKFILDYPTICTAHYIPPAF